MSLIRSSVMNPYGDSPLDPHPPQDLTSPPPYSSAGPHQDSHDAPLSVGPSRPVIRTGQSSVTVLCPHPSSDQDGGQSQDHHPSRSPLSPGSPAPAPTLNPYPTQTIPNPYPTQTTPNPYPTYTLTPPSGQISIIIPSPDLRPSPAQPQCSEDTCPDLECSICFSQFNNVFRCPKMLQCQHTFCLECLARINVKSLQPNAIQCPLCRGLTPLPALGLPRLATDSNVLSYLPAAMQRVYSIRFLRNKGKLQVKRASGGRHRTLASLRAENRSLDVGLPSPPVRGRDEEGGVGGALFRLTGRPACRAFLLTSLVMMMVLLTGIVVFLITISNGFNGE